MNLSPQRRREIGFAIAIIVGLIIGKLIKKMSIGFFIAIILILLVLMTFGKRKNN